MQRRSFLGAAAAVSIGAAVKGSSIDSAYAIEMASPEPTGENTKFRGDATVVLVHAAWADGYCWNPIIVPLERHGLKVICAPIPLTSLTNDANALVASLERTTGPLILVGHAYSGAVIAAIREDRVKALVYISALAPDEGETVAKVFYRDTASPVQPKLAPDSDGLIWMSGEGVRQALAQNASSVQKAIAAAVQRPISVQCIQEPAPTPLWKSKPAWYLVAEQDRMINPKTQRFMGNRMHATIHSHPVDHTCMYSQPHVAIDIILEAARQTLAK